MKLMIVGHGRAGKDEAGNYLSLISTLRFAGATSKYIAPHVAKYLGVSCEEAYEDRRWNRSTWYAVGKRLRDSDPGVLVRQSLLNGDIIVGVRDRAEVEYAQKNGLVDLVIWIENSRVPVDPTVEFGSEVADVIIRNDWSLAEYHDRLSRLARSWGVMRDE